MHSFTNEQLGVDLDSSIYTGFIKKTRNAAVDLIVEEVEDVESNGTLSTGKQMSLLVKNQIEMFKGNIFTPAANLATPQSPGFNGN